MYSITDKKTIEYLCNKYGLRLKKGLGQNFLTDESVIGRIVDAADIENKPVIEIGPGIGVLTAGLASRAAKVLSVEIDSALMPVLKETLAGFNNIEVINEDILKLNLLDIINDKLGGGKVSVAANLPYYITTPIIMGLLEQNLPLDNIVIMVQKEVADRICANPGSKDYGLLTVMVRYYCIAQKVCDVDKGKFIPMPSVDSAVIKLAVMDKTDIEVKDEKAFKSLVKAAFAQRRKTLLNAVKNSGKFGSKEDILIAFESAGIDPMVRGEKLSVWEFAKLSNTFCEK
jgi:16S rRNA (adenine1518-N6/adenine1519-N6)-dimethyltransferase